MARWQYQILAEPPNSRPLVEQLTAFTTYPDRLLRARLQVASMQAAALDPFPRPPEFERPIFEQYPATTRRASLLPANIPAVAWEPFPRPLVAQLTGQAFYPDRLTRRHLTPALMPSFAYGTWEPIPNPPSVVIYDTDIHLGTKESTGVTGNPTIGGWQAW